MFMTAIVGVGIVFFVMIVCFLLSFLMGLDMKGMEKAAYFTLFFWSESPLAVYHFFKKLSTIAIFQRNCMEDSRGRSS